MKRLWILLIVTCMCMEARGQANESEPPSEAATNGVSAATTNGLSELPVADQGQSSEATEAEAPPADSSGDETQASPPPATPALEEDITELNLSGGQVDVQAVGSDTVIITAPKQDLQLLRDLVKRLDKEGPRKELRVLSLQNKNASEVASKVQSIMREMQAGRERPEEQVSIVPVSNNILLVAAPASQLDEVETIVKAIDERPPSLPELEKMNFRLKYIKAAEAATKLQELISALRVRQGEEPGTEIQVFPVDASNSLIVIGPVDEREKIQALIDEIDVEPVEGFGDLRLAYFPLLNSEATKMAEVLNDLLSTPEGEKAAAETIRRIRMVVGEPGPDGERHELPPINLERQIKLIPDEESQALICATSEENIEPLQALISLLDSVPMAVEQGLKIFPLKYADAKSVKDMLDDMFKQGKDLPRPAPGTQTTEAVPTDAIGKSLVYNVGISADVRTNTLVVTGRTEQLLLVTGIIQSVDVPGSDLKHPLRLLTLEHTDATRISKVIDELWQKRIDGLEKRDAGKAAVAREEVFVAVDIRTNSLIVSATEENFAEIAHIAQMLDTAPGKLVDQIRIIDCEHTSAADLASKIEDLWKRKADLRREGEMPEDLPIIVADQRSNALIIASSPEDFEEIKRLVERLEAQPLAPIAEIRLIQLQNNDASQIADMLQKLFEDRMKQRLAQGQEEIPSDRVALVAEPATNTILVASSKENYDEMMHIVEAIDVEPDLEGVVQVFTLRNAQAENVADQIKKLFDEGLYTGVFTSDNQIAKERQKVAIVADPRSNAIIASASKTNLSIIEKLVQQMDTDKAPMLNADTRIFRLQYADSMKIASILDRLFEGMGGSSQGDFKAPTIVADAASNTLIITGSRDGIKRATDLIASLDHQTDQTSLTRVYDLKYASALKLAAKLQEVFKSRQEGAKETERSPTFIMPDEATNSLIATAAEEDHALIEHLLSLLDVESTISGQVAVFPLKKAKAEPLAQSLEDLFKAGPQTGIDSGRADAIAIKPDKRTNSLIVWASRTEMENISQIIQKLDSTEPATQMSIKVIPLHRALAEELAKTLTDTINKQSSGGGGGGDNSESVIVTFDETQPDGTVLKRKLLRQDIVINPDQRTNSLFVMAPAGSMDMLENLILSIDRIPPTVAEIRLFPLANADAEDVVKVLEELFQQKETKTGPETQLQLADLTAGVAGAAGTGEGESLPGQTLRFTANRRTNMVIAAGSETDLDMIETLVRRLDAQDVEERIRQVYEARYTPAPDIATALGDFFQKEDELFSGLQDEQSVMRQAERQVTAVSDESTNTVLLGFSPRNYSRTMEMVYAIDRPPPQVVVQVLIAEVALDDRLEFGMEFALQDLSFSKNAVVGPNGIVTGHDFDFVGGTDVGAAGASGSFGGFSFAITGEDFNFLLRALQSDGSLEVLSRPTITVENNEAANITIGDNVPFLRNSQVTDSGQVNSSVDYEEVGIILDVTPHINPDGYVNLEIKPEISQLNQGSNVQISEGLSAPTFSKRSAETVVTVKDGETVVIGGLIQTQEDQRETKVPILGDIPVVGNLFRATQNTRRRTELLIVLTVNVIRSEQDFHEQSVKLRDQSGFLPDKIKRNPLMGGIRILPGEKNEGDFDDNTQDQQQPSPWEDKPRYGPTPDIYGPPRKTSDEKGLETFGPPHAPADSKKSLETFGPPRPKAQSEPVALNTSAANK